MEELKKNINEISDNRIIYLDAAKAGYPTTVVKITYGQIQEVITFAKTRNLDENMLFLLKIENSIKNVDINKIYQTDKEAWSNFCTDITMYYAMRYAVFNEALPMVPSSIIINDCKTEELDKVNLNKCVTCFGNTKLSCKICGTNYCSVKCQKIDWKLHKEECKLFEKYSNGK